MISNGANDTAIIPEHAQNNGDQSPDQVIVHRYWLIYYMDYYPGLDYSSYLDSDLESIEFILGYSNKERKQGSRRRLRVLLAFKERVPIHRYTAILGSLGEYESQTVGLPAISAILRVAKAKLYNVEVSYGEVPARIREYMGTL